MNLTPIESPLLSIQHATLSYGRRPVLQDVSFDIRSGEFWCFIGPNGEGKTTLIKALLGAMRPRRGRIARRRDVFGKGRVSYVPQRLELNPVLPTSIREFVLGGLAGVRADGVQCRSRLRQVLDLVGLSQRMEHRNYWTLSGGQRQRAMVARALIRDPRLLIVDEPIAGLDFAAAEAVLRVLDQLNQQHSVTIVFVTHDLPIAGAYATHIALFRGGRVRAGRKSQVLDGDALSATFGVAIAVTDEGDGRLRIGRRQHPAPMATADTRSEAVGAMA